MKGDRAVKEWSAQLIVMRYYNNTQNSNFDEMRWSADNLHRKRRCGAGKIVCLAVTGEADYLTS
jgi:hypothetical protein